MDFQGFMNSGGWAVFSVFCAVFLAGFFLVNQYFKQPGHILVFWMRVLVVLVLTPFIPHIVLPADPQFYIAVFFTVLAGTFADIRTFNVSAQYGGGVVSRVQPVTVIGAFFLWFLFQPALLAAYAAQPLRTGGIVAALLGCVFFAMRLNRCAITRAALKAMIPALAGYTLVTALNKFAMGHGTVEGAVFGYMYVQSVIAVFAVGGYALWRERRAPKTQVDAGSDMPARWMNRSMALAALWTTAAWLCLMIYKNYAMAFTPNPSFVSALSLMAPVFVALFYRFAKFKEKADVFSGIGIVVCAMLLVLMTVH